MPDNQMVKHGRWRSPRVESMSTLTPFGKRREWPARRRAGARRELRGSLSGHHREVLGG